MLELIEKFLILYVVIFCFYKILFIIKDNVKKTKNIYTTEMIYLSKIYGIDINILGKKYVENHIILINTFIIVIDLLLYICMESVILKLILMFIATLVLIFICYSILGRYYIKILYKGV